MLSRGNGPAGCATLGSERLSYAVDKIAAEVEARVGRSRLPAVPSSASVPPLWTRTPKGPSSVTLRHGPGHMVRALLEGVTFALRQIIDAMVGCGAELDRLVASGNGLASPLWRQMLADVLNRPLCQGKDKHAAERAGVGAARLPVSESAPSTATTAHRASRQNSMRRRLRTLEASSSTKSTIGASLSLSAAEELVLLGDLGPPFAAAVWDSGARFPRNEKAYLTRSSRRGAPTRSGGGICRRRKRRNSRSERSPKA